MAIGAIALVAALAAVGLHWFFDRDEIGHGSKEVTVTVRFPADWTDCGSVSQIEAFGGRWYAEGGVPGVVLALDAETGDRVGRVTGTFVVQEGSEAGVFVTTRGSARFVLVQDGKFAPAPCLVDG